MPIYGDDLDNTPLYTIGGGRGRGHFEVITSGSSIDEDWYDHLGAHCGEYE